MKGNKGVSSMGFTLVAVLFILSFHLPCFSQPPLEGGPRGSDSPVFGGDESNQPIERRENIRKRIELIRMWKLTKELDLTEETGVKLFPILHKYDEKRFSLEKERRNIMDQLRRALENEATSDEEIKAGIENLEKNALAASDLIRQQREEFKGVLSLRQQAKFILFQRQFHREIRKIIAEARQRNVKARRDDRPKRD